MRLAIDGRYINDHFPGIARYTFNLVDALARIAPQQTFTLLHNPALADTRFGVAKLGRHGNVELVQADAPTFSPAEQLKLPRLARSLALDVLHSPYYVKPYRLPCASIITIHDLIPLIYPQHLPSRRARIVYRIAITLAVRSADAIITDSHSAARDLQRHCKVPPASLTVIPIAAAPVFKPQPRLAVEALRQKYSLPQRYALFLASNKPHKNLLRLVEAWSLLHNRRLAGEAKLVIAGHWDSRYPEAKQRAFELGLAGEILFVGAVAEEELPALYSGAALFAFPSLYEGFGLPVLEAMSCGTAVICSNTSSLPEVAGDAALQVDPLDVKMLAEAITRLLHDDGLRESLAARGLARAGQFSWEAAAQATLALYQQAGSGARE
jgi:glycosyltransferase involved in cell wall biosynthesis